MSEDISSHVGTINNIPDFRWPDQVCDTFHGWLNEILNGISNKVQAVTKKQPVLRNLIQALCWTGIVYIAIIWICACYVHFPISPYGLWDIVAWIFMAGGLVIAGLSLFYGVATVAMMLWALVLFAFIFALSLLHLCWTVLDASHKKSEWLRSYQGILAVGVGAVFLLATYIDGSYRFWDSPFDSMAWAKTVLIALSAWAALFCYVVRDKVMEVETPRKIMKWTLSLVLAIGLFVNWNAGGKRTEYFLVKSIREHPNDQNAWLKLGSYYSDEGDSLANDSGDDEHGPPDPSPSYAEALQCFNHAVELGATGYEVNLIRAQLADAVGQKHNALIYGQMALKSASTLPSSENMQKDVKWLHEMVARNVAAPDTEEKEDRARQIHKQRIVSLPRIVRWIFEVP